MSNDDDRDDRVLKLLGEMMVEVRAIEPKINAALTHLEARINARIDAFEAQTQDDFGEVRARLRRIEGRLDLP